MDSRQHVDRLSMLPDDLIHKIFSFTSFKNAIQTTVLSSRWRSIWTSVDLYSARLSLYGTVRETLVKGVLHYAFSRNVQELTVTCLLDDPINFPLHLFRSQSLNYLGLTGSNRGMFSFVLASTWDLPALTTLRLDHVTFDKDDDKGIALFSKCTNLKSLAISDFAVKESKTFTLSHPRLSNLTLEDGHWTLNDVSVVAPQLENLTIQSFHSHHLITAPNLTTLCFRSSYLLQFSTDMHSLEKVDFHIYSAHKWTGSRIAALLQQIRSVKFLTLNLKFIKLVSSYMERVSRQPSPFTNLKSLKIHPDRVDKEHKKVNVSTQVIKYLLAGSPTATFTMISYKEFKEQQQKAQAFANTESRMDQRKPPVKNATMLKIQLSDCLNELDTISLTSS
ncbi:putative F-box domain, leucine-rich repeat domain superfamily, F-box-like domain superfamily [Helianthus annuus]|nr:putative F-box domain, leucine-rich repeat domain superfamily, F-box-like domain superfamily [Helianthus annuus]KAJ0865920.1 putative F-box domain, leucine-rich repeat domain superfamily, F-box-like domain superfamily [Helianthus annuus]